MYLRLCSWLTSNQLLPLASRATGKTGASISMGNKQQMKYEKVAAVDVCLPYITFDNMTAMADSHVLTGTAFPSRPSIEVDL
ncbi:hypothetical protein EYF80_019926 [Liparis tanakae]|uniref:Uncharacterized protein n=1 Tax=Liparis tanakae TaxID=230148 RepID=A0A4Z2HW04_9TELE|nr:hypothetical protein EYF80_019926 [Liparis tanakae]